MKGRSRWPSKFEEPVTFHDPCNVVRGRGLHEKAREVVRAFCPNFIEMTPNKEHNYMLCRWRRRHQLRAAVQEFARVESNSVKAEQLQGHRRQGLCIAPCHNCHGGLEDIIHKYKLDMQLKFLGEIIYDCMEKPNAV
jgi:Fe-S oxidoreductase